MTWLSREQLNAADRIARRERDQRLREWIDGPRRCGCRVPLPARQYGPVWQCRLCAKPIEREAA